MNHHKNSGNRNHVRDGHRFSDLYKPAVSDGTFPNSHTPVEGYVIPVHIQNSYDFPLAMPPTSPHISLYKGVVSNSIFPNSSMSFPEALVPGLPIWIVAAQSRYDLDETKYI